MGRNRHLPPGPIAHARGEVFALPRLGVLGPLADADDLLAEPRRGRIDAADAQECALVGVVREPTLEFVGTDIVGPSLDQGKGGLPAEQGLQRAGQAREVARHDLALEGERRGGDDRCLPRAHRVLDRRDEVGQRLARAGPRLHQQVGPLLDGGGDRVGHGDLTLTSRPPDAGHGGGQQVVEGRHQSTVCRGVTCAPRRLARLWTGKACQCRTQREVGDRLGKREHRRRCTHHPRPP